MFVTSQQVDQTPPIKFWKTIPEWIKASGDWKLTSQSIYTDKNVPRLHTAEYFFTIEINWPRNSSIFRSKISSKRSQVQLSVPHRHSAKTQESRWNQTVCRHARCKQGNIPRMVRASAVSLHSRGIVASNYQEFSGDEATISNSEFRWYCSGFLYWWGVVRVYFALICTRGLFTPQLVFPLFARFIP